MYYKVIFLDDDGSGETAVYCASFEEALEYQDDEDFCAIIEED